MKKMCKVDEVFLFILEKSKGDIERKVEIKRIKDNFGLKKTATNNYLQVLLKYGLVKRDSSDKKSGYYSDATIKEYDDFVKNKRDRKININKKATDEMMNEFIYSGCPERVGTNLNVFA